MPCFHIGRNGPGLESGYLARESSGKVITSGIRPSYRRSRPNYLTNAGIDLDSDPGIATFTGYLAASRIGKSSASATTARRYTRPTIVILRDTSATITAPVTDTGWPILATIPTRSIRAASGTTTTG